MEGLGAVGMIVGVIAAWIVLQLILRKAGIQT